MYVVYIEYITNYIFIHFIKIQSIKIIVDNSHKDYLKDATDY